MAHSMKDYSPHHPKAITSLANASNLVLIDNYDSFTWNVYQYLTLEGASVKVYRNDKISLEDLIALNPTQLVVSPGPGHPATDSGVSNEAIRYFAGKIPILGICMGQQCMITAFGGEVTFAGEILHGKTSALKHDGKGLYSGMAQELPVTRYHSLAGSRISLPDCFEVSSWSVKEQSPDSSIIMGVRHKSFVIEGVQFHPESILTAEGRSMIGNFLAMHGGTWAENIQLLSKHSDADKSLSTQPRAAAPATKQNILDQIYAHRRQAVSKQKLVPSQRPEDFQQLYKMGLAPPLVSFVNRLNQTPFPLALMAEIKRASPSKGIISLSASAPLQARAYALAGASVISVLTEPNWFKGSLDDLRAVRQSLDCMPSRPAILRKEFIFEEYQILEARLAGADSVLLIVKMLDRVLLQRLYKYSVSLGMEPLVEVNNDEEMKEALSLNAKVIGVNNRNLTNFEVDLGTTSRLLQLAPDETILCALSGISSPEDVEPYKKIGVGAVLIGEALMRAPDVKSFIQHLLEDTNKLYETVHPVPMPMVKICGTRTLEAAQCAVSLGAAFIGLILVNGRKRTVSPEEALKISAFIHSRSPRVPADKPSQIQRSVGTDYFVHTSFILLAKERPFLVGVFQDQPLEFILTEQRKLQLDVVQLHGSEPLEWTRLIPVPVFKAFKPQDPQLSKRGFHALPLLDSAGGGTGKRLDLEAIKTIFKEDPSLRVILAGGLEPNNLAAIKTELGSFLENVVGFDVSSGVETDGAQNLGLIKDFIESAKGPSNGD
ncbi:MAG: bifunctional tryptophan synthase trp1 [Vezdaea aestivalis]|nr:MAG: bifunctional tryptophan synthase trp1 [Vezdaea aestivalis]